jgi:hypothetical protein
VEGPQRQLLQVTHILLNLRVHCPIRSHLFACYHIIFNSDPFEFTSLREFYHNFESLSPPLLPPLANQPTIQVSPPKKLSWADDVVSSLPIIIPPTVPCDFSCLRSEKIQPFGALHQRDRRTRRQPRKPRNQKTFIPSDTKSQSVPGSIPHHSYPISFISSSCISTKSHKHSPLYFSPLRVSPPSHFNWESDPRLFALSSALKALGWNRGVS